MSHPEIRDIVNDLRTVKDFGEFPRGRNHLFSLYKNEGYVFMGNKKIIGGGKTAREYITPKSKVKLTRKGHLILKHTKDVL